MRELVYLFSQLRWYDILDILLVTSMVVWLYSWVRGTRAFRVLLGLGLLIVIYVWAQSWGLVLTQFALQGLGQALLIFVIVIFAPEIRQVLERLNPMRIWNRPEQERPHDYVDEVVGGVQVLAAQSIGALLVFEREDPLRELVRHGIPLDGEIQKDILVSIFQPRSPTHDGAVWIRDGRIHQVGVFLPISQRDLPSYFGSRHRAAVGITEVSDALVVVVSEERGRISVAEEGTLQELEDFGSLSPELRQKLRPGLTLERPTWKGLFLREWRVKLISLLLITGFWFALAGRQQVEEIYSVPVETYNLPADLRLVGNPASMATVRVSGTRLALARLDPAVLKVRVDLSRVSPGTNIVPIDPGRIMAPVDVTVASVDPPFLNVEAEKRAVPSVDN